MNTKDCGKKLYPGNFFCNMVYHCDEERRGERDGEVEVEGEIHVHFHSKYLIWLQIIAP